MLIAFPSTYADAVAQKHCAHCLRAETVVKKRKHVCVQFEGKPDKGRLGMRTLLVCDWCYTYVMSEYLDFGVYDWQRIYLRFRDDDEKTRYRFDSRFRCND